MLAKQVNAPIAFLRREALACQRLVVPDKLIHHSKTRVSNAQRSPWGKLMPSSRAAMNAPPQGLTT